MRVHALPILAAIVTLALLSGCHSHRHGYDPHNDWPLYDERGAARSLVLTTPGVRNAQLLPPTYEPWYISRNDMGPSVVAGYEEPEYSSSVTYTRDRRSIYNGRVRDHFDETTYRRTYRRYAR